MPFFSGDGLRCEHHLQRLLEADKTWQPLRASPSWDDAQLQLWKPYLRFGDSDSEVAGDR